MISRQQAIDVLHENGMRLTPQRSAVLSCLEGNTSHPAVADIARYVQESMPSVSMSTIYSILHEFSSIGLVSELDEKDGVRIDPNTEPHAHLLCSKCGKIVDIPMPAGLNSQVADAVKNAGGTFDECSVDIVGICPACK